MQPQIIAKIVDLLLEVMALVTYLEMHSQFDGIYMHNS